MLALIRHEFESIWLYLFMPVGFVLFSIIGIFGQMAIRAGELPPVGVPEGMYVAFWVPLWLLPFIMAGLGAAQMHGDRSKKISAYLCTLATSRERILAARIIAGLALMVIIVMPLAIADAVFLVVYPRLVPIDVGSLVDRFAVVLAVNLAGYAVGLLMGWNTNKYFATLGSIVLCLVLIGVMAIKGFGGQTCVILLLVAAAGLARTGQRFMRSAL